MPAWPPANSHDLTAFNEGCRNVPYYDQFGFPTNGRGHKLSNIKYAPLNEWPVATDDQVDAWFTDDLATAEAECRRIFGTLWDQMNDARHGAFIDMAFEMGEAGLQNFHGMIAAVEAGDWTTAAGQAKASLWDRQVPHRAAHDEALIATGDWASITAYTAASPTISQ
jgi:lysozyme